LLRIFAISSCGMLMAGTAITFYVYLLAWKRFPHRRGLIPRYVVGVSTYVILVEVLFIVLVNDLIRRDAPLTIYGPIISLANLVLAMSLFSIFRFEQRRVNAATTAGYDPATFPARRAEDLAPPERRWWGLRAPKTPVTPPSEGEP
jgi:hypothetical protein